MSREHKEKLASGIVDAQIGARSAATAARAMGRIDLAAMLDRAEILARAAEKAIDHPLPVEIAAP